MTARRGFTPRFVVSRSDRGTLRTVAVPLTRTPPAPRENHAASGAVDVPGREDVVVRQVHGGWQVEDDEQQPLY